MASIPNVNMTNLNAQMQQLQQSVEQITAMQQQVQDLNPKVAAETPVQPTTQPVVKASTYPKSFRSDTVEDILNNPVWKQELAVEFNESELGAKSKNYTELLFMEFCERQTGKPSVMLNNMRQKAQEDNEKNKKDVAPVG